MAEDMVREIRRQGSRVFVVLSSGEGFLLPRALYRLRPFSVGQSIDVAQYLAELKPEARQLAQERAAFLLGQRDYSLKGMHRKLLDAGFPEDIVDSVCESLERHGYISDERFAGQLLERERRRSGPRRIVQKMMEKGLDGDLARETVASLDADEELESAIIQARKYLRGKEPDQDTRRRAFAYLARRGYGTGIASRALQALSLEEDDAGE